MRFQVRGFRDARRICPGLLHRGFFYRGARQVRIREITLARSPISCAGMPRRLRLWSATSPGDPSWMWDAPRDSFSRPWDRPGIGMVATLLPSWPGWRRKQFPERITEVGFEDYSPGRTFDVITMWDVIEHVADPVACLKKASSLLNDDGFLFIGTPDTASPVVHILGKHWYHYIPPTHLHFFSRWNIPIFLRNNGFAMKRLRYFGKYVTLAEIMLDLSYMFRHAGLRRLSEKVSNYPSWNLNIPYMVFDDMVVMARKSSLQNG